MKLFLKTKDYAVSGEEFQLWYNEEMEMLETRPVPAVLLKYYQSEDYISHTDSQKTLTERLYQRVKKYALGKKLKLINSFSTREKSLLDVGAGTGDFLVSAQQDGWKVMAVEPNEKAGQKAREKGIDVHLDLDALEGNKFQVITLWHVLEHLPDLETQIIKLKNLLAEDGKLLVAVPNFRSYDAHHYGEFWAAYDVPRHLWHFSKKAISKLFEMQDLKVVQVRPMIFDAFYVSLLSEKYRSGHNRFFRAFWYGLRSNLAAYRSKEYSSLLFVIQKHQKAF